MIEPVVRLCHNNDIRIRSRDSVRLKPVVGCEGSGVQSSRRPATVWGAAADNVSQLLPARLDRARVEQLAAQVQIAAVV